MINNDRPSRLEKKLTKEWLEQQPDRGQPVTVLAPPAEILPARDDFSARLDEICIVRKG